MRNEYVAQLVAALKGPIAHFVREARVRTTLLINGSGQVLAQHGFTRSYEVMNVAALAAAAHASARALADMTQGSGWTHLHHAGRHRQLFLAPIRTPIGELILVAIFDGDSSLGLVQLFFDELAAQVAALPELRRNYVQTTQQTFERDLESGLKTVLYPEANGEG